MFRWGRGCYSNRVAREDLTKIGGIWIYSWRGWGANCGDFWKRAEGREHTSLWGKEHGLVWQRTYDTATLIRADGRVGSDRSVTPYSAIAKSKILWGKEVGFWFFHSFFSLQKTHLVAKTDLRLYIFVVLINMNVHRFHYKNIHVVVLPKIPLRVLYFTVYLKLEEKKSLSSGTYLAPGSWTRDDGQGMVLGR